MKQELTIAFGLLAVGAAMCLRPSADVGAIVSSFFELSATVEEPSLAVQEPSIHVASDADFQPAAEHFLVKQASFVEMPAPVVVENPIKLGQARPARDFRDDGRTRDRAELMLRRAQHMIDDGRAFESDVQVRATLFEQTVVGAGLYLQAGQGGGQTRTELTFRTLSSSQRSLHQPLQRSAQDKTIGPTANQPVPEAADGALGAPEQQILNLCDGRFVYRLHQDLIADEQTLEFYDLQRIKNAKSKSQNDTRPVPIRPGKLMASGMAGLLQHLASEFRFAIVPPSTSQENAVPESRLLRGTWNPQQLHALLRDQVSSEQINQGISWSQLPPNLPHAVELTLVANESWGLFPSEIRFYQFQARDKQTWAQPIVVIQFGSPKLLARVADDQFVLRSRDLEATDLTHQYLSKLRPTENDTLR